MAKIHNYDTLAVRKAVKIIPGTVEGESSSIKERFQQRVQEIEIRLASSDNEKHLETLYHTSKFYRDIAAFIDYQFEIIKYLCRTYESLDELFWEGVLKGDQLAWLQSDNAEQKLYISNLLKREDLLLAGIRRLKGSLNKAA